MRDTEDLEKLVVEHVDSVETKAERVSEVAKLVTTRGISTSLSLGDILAILACLKGRSYNERLQIDLVKRIEALFTLP